MPDGSTTFQSPAAALIEAPPAEQVFGVHGFGLDRYSGANRATTFLFADAAQKRPLGWKRGHVQDGDLIDGATLFTKCRVVVVGEVR